MESYEHRLVSLEVRLADVERSVTILSGLTLLILLILSLMIGLSFA